MADLDVSDVLRDLGRRIAELRTGARLTQDQFSEILDVTVQYLQRIEGGRENLTVASLVRLANHFHIHAADLFAAPASRAAPPGRPRKHPLPPKEVAPNKRVAKAKLKR